MKRTGAFEKGVTKKPSTQMNRSATVGQKSKLYEKAINDQYDEARRETYRLEEEDRMAVVYKRKENIYKKDNEDLASVAYKTMTEEERYKVGSQKPKIQHPLLKKMSKSSLKQGIIFSEVLGKPKGY